MIGASPFSRRKRRAALILALGGIAAAPEGFGLRARAAEIAVAPEGTGGAGAWRSYLGSASSPAGAPFLQPLGITSPAQVQSFIRVMAQTDLAPQAVAAPGLSLPQQTALIAAAADRYAQDLVARTESLSSLAPADARAAALRTQKEFADFGTLAALAPRRREALRRGREAAAAAAEAALLDPIKRAGASWNDKDDAAATAGIGGGTREGSAAWRLKRAAPSAAPSGDRLTAGAEVDPPAAGAEDAGASLADRLGARAAQGWRSLRSAVAGAADSARAWRRARSAPDAAAPSEEETRPAAELAFPSRGIERVHRLELVGNVNVDRMPSDAAFPLAYYKLPREWADVESAGPLPAELRGLIYEDERTIRWFFHPDDRVFQAHVQRALKARGLDSRSYVLPGESAAKTSSRSSFLSGIPYSLRMSITDGFGAWTGRTKIPDQWDDSKTFDRFDKNVTPRDAAWAQEAGGRIRNAPDSYAWVQPDVARVDAKIPALDDRGWNPELSYSFRDVSRFSDESRRYLPGFVTYHPETSAYLAAIDGAVGSYASAARRDGRARGLAAADLLLKSQLVVSSAHSQNYVLETDRFYRFTGRVLDRDVGDTFLPDGMYGAFASKTDPALAPQALAELRRRFPGRTRLHEMFRRDHLAPETIPVGFAWRHGATKEMKWTDAANEEFARAFQDAFFGRVSELTGVDAERLRAIAPYKKYPGPGYFYDYLLIDGASPAWQDVLARLREGGLKDAPIPELPAAPELEAALGHVEAGRSAELAAFAAREPAAAIKALLIAKLDGRPVDGFAQTLRAVERTFPSAPDRDWLAQALVLAGSRDPAVLAHHLGDKRADDYSRRVAAAAAARAAE